MEKLYSHKILFPLFLLHLQFSSVLLVSSDYTLPDKYFINCGSDSNILLRDNRTFLGERKSGVFFPAGRSDPVENKNSSSDPSSLYHTARIYKRPSFYYELDINMNGTYLVRLHFFAFSSPPTNLADAIFSVTASNYPKETVLASGFSLLSNFSARNSTNSPVIEEFLLTNINVGKFRIEFLPSQEPPLAFVNAIEVFIAPEGFINETSQVNLAKSNGNYSGLLAQVLHTIHRINVGGLTLTPENDSLWRNWIPDDRYLIQPEAARNAEKYSDTPKYNELGRSTKFIAPPFVYMSAKALNIESSRQTNFSNLTWRVEVSKNATHLIRVHFCDIVSWVLSVFTFNLYINSKLVEGINPYDRVGDLKVPFYNDFMVDSDGSGFMNISISPQQNSSDKTTFLNGLEIMELMKKSGPVNVQIEPKKKYQPIVFGSVGGGVALICIVLGGFLSVLKCRKAKPDQTLNAPLYGWGSSNNRSSDRNANVSLADLGLRISFAEIQRATKNFNDKLLIGKGGFGKVYEGTFPGKKVAVKRSEQGHGQGVLEFQTEIRVLSQIRHRRLVSLIGYCEERSEMILVYEFMEKGTLRDHLYTVNKDTQKSCSCSELSWKQRLQICIDAAEGLHYLHTGLKEEIIHHDVKSTNILLDENYVAKVADFGLSRSGPPDPDHSGMDLKGSFGYLDPESVRTLQYTEKSDVYSFGVVLLEVVCARPALMDSVPDEERSLAEWGMSWLKRGQLEKIIDPFLVDKMNPISFRKFSETAERCLNKRGIDRPTMQVVLYDLKYALGLQQTATHREPHEDSTINASWELPLPVVQRLPSNVEDDVPIEGDDDSVITASALLSQSRIDDA